MNHSKCSEKEHESERSGCLYCLHPPKLQACKDNVNIGTEKADRLGEFNDMLVGARPPKVQKALILTCICGDSFLRFSVLIVSIGVSRVAFRRFYFIYWHHLYGSIKL